MTPKAKPDQIAIIFSLEEAKRMRRMARSESVAHPEDDEVRRIWFRFDLLLRRRNVSDDE